MIYPVIAYGATVAALLLVARAVRALLSIYKKGQPDPTRSTFKKERLTNMLKETLGHTKMLNFSVTGVAHWFVMIGFGSLFGTLVTAYGQVFNPEFALPVIGHWQPYLWFTQFIAWATGIGIVVLIAIRQGNRWIHKGRTSRFLGSVSWRAYYVEATILAIVVCVIALYNLEQTNPTSEAIKVWATAKIVISMAWFIVISLNLTMGVAWHRFLAFFNIFYKRIPGAATDIGKPALGALPVMLSHGKEINFDDPADDDVFGLGERGDITWKALLDMTTCTECGRCQSQCPAWHTEKPLSPKLLMMAMRDHAMASTVESEKMVGPAGAISSDILWSCTTCGACVNECPVDIEHIDHIVNMRRFQVLVESEFPSQLQATYRNLEMQGNPWGSNKNDREAWIADCDFPVQVITGEIPEDIEYLFWVGCAGAYEERAKKTTKAVAELLHIAGVKFAVLGKRETCTGDSARRTGNEFVYQILAKENIETFEQVYANYRGKKKVVATCPHCFTTIGRDYKQQGFELEMVHHTQLLNQLVRDGKLKPVSKGANESKSITYHDPCYLGRHNQIYSPPRELLQSAGLQIKEMPRNQERSFCCGAGGGRMWQEEKLGTQINLNRVDEAIATGAEEVAVACPFCRVMVTDGVQGRQADVEVLDVAQALLRSVKP